MFSRVLLTGSNPDNVAEQENNEPEPSKTDLLLPDQRHDEIISSHTENDKKSEIIPNNDQGQIKDIATDQLEKQIRQRRVLFVIAHPDDECMFFGPTILHFTQNEKAMVFLVCLTNG